MKSVNCSKPGYTSITCSKISNISHNLIFTTKFNDSSITIVSCDYLNLSLANEYVGDVTILTQVIKYNQNSLQVEQPIRLQFSNQIKLLTILFCVQWPSSIRTPFMAKCTQYNIMCKSFSVTCDRLVVFSGYFDFLLQ
jgi:hypothetical protein